jgi:DNA-binding transcriptional LysR family regulator
LLGGFRDAHPDARLVCRELNFAEQTDAIVSGRVDVAIVRSPLIHPEVETVQLFTEPRVLLVHHGHPLAKRQSVTGRQLLDLSMLDLRSVRQEWNAFWQLDDIRGEPGRRSPSFAVTMDEVHIDMVLSGAALTVAASVPRLAANRHLASVPIENVSGSVISLVSRRGSRRRNVDAFIRHAQVIAREASTLVPGAEPAAPGSW